MKILFVSGTFVWIKSGLVEKWSCAVLQLNAGIETLLFLGKKDTVVSCVLLFVSRSIVEIYLIVILCVQGNSLFC